MFTFVLLPLLIGLGFWQLDREQEIKALQQAFAERRQAQATELDQLDLQSDALAFTPVTTTGYFDNSRSFLLDNRLRDSVPGYEVLTPFHTGGGQVVIVNRGWIAQGARRDVLPELDGPEGELRLRGHVHVPTGEAFLLGDEQEAGFGQWPKVIQSLDLALMAAELQQPQLFPYSIRLASGSPGALRADWPMMNMMPEKHRAYAVQWFTMAAVLLGLFLYTTLLRPERGRRDEANSDHNTHDR